MQQNAQFAHAWAQDIVNFVLPYAHVQIEETLFEPWCLLEGRTEACNDIFSDCLKDRENVVPLIRGPEG